MMPGRDQDALIAASGVSRETWRRLDLLASELVRWQSVKNLVGRKTLEDVWTRHILDSLQLLPIVPHAERWLDLGSGAGFPGLVAAIAGTESGLSVDLVESNARKCAFLRHAARITGAPAVVHARRLESAVPDFVGTAQVVSARALAPLDSLLGWTAPLLTTGTVGLFPKGRGWAAELTAARKSWKFELEVIPSRTDPDAGILKIASLASAPS